jgi:hypothetical protein
MTQDLSNHRLHQRDRIRGSLLIMLTILLGTLWPSTALAAQELSDLWIDIRLDPPLVDWFNREARIDDVGHLPLRRVSLLDQVTAGQKMVVFFSVAEAEPLLPTLADEIDIIGYNLEHGPATPAEEQADPVASVKRMRALAQQYDLELAMGPDRRFALEHGIEIAPYVDYFVLQVQRVQDDPATVFGFALPLIQDLRQANPDLRISVQVRTEGSVEHLVALIDSLKSDIDGVSILTSPETMEFAKTFIRELRSKQPSTPAAPTATETVGALPNTKEPTPGHPTATQTQTPTRLPTTEATSKPSPISTRHTRTTMPPTDDLLQTSASAATTATTSAPTPTLTAEPLPEPTPPMAECTWSAGLVFAGSGMVAMILQRRRKRLER